MAFTDPSRIRTTINVDRAVYEIFVGMAESGGMSVGKCIGEWLADTAEGAQFVATKMQEARQAPMVVMREMQALASGFQVAVEDEIVAIRQKAKKPVPPAASARGVPASSPGGGRRGGAAPSSNTGRKVQERTTPRGRS